MTVTRTRVALLAAAGALVYGGVIALAATSDNAATSTVAIVTAAGLSFTATGIVAISRRPENRTGLLMLSVGFLWALGSLTLTNSSLLFTISAVTGQLGFGPLTHLLLAYPSGVLERRYHRRLVVAVWATVFLGPLLISLVEPRPTDCNACPQSAFVIDANHALSLAAQIGYAAAAVALALAVLVELVRKFGGASPPLRRVLSPVYAMFSAALVFLIASNVADAFSGRASTALSVVAVVFIALVPVAFLAGLLRSRLAHSSVLGLLVALEDGTPLRAALGSALGDPSLEIAYRLDNPSRWVDENGREVAEPVSGGGRSATTVERHDERIGTLVHDASLDEDPELVRGVAAAAALSLQAQRAQAALRNQYAYLAALVDTTPSLLVTIDLEGRILTHNSAVLEASGYEENQSVTGQYFWDVFIDPGEREAMRARFAEAAPQHPAAEYENAFTNRRGDERVIFWRSAPVHDEEGRVASIVAGGVDITERRQREEEIRAAEERLRAVIESAPVAIVEIGQDGNVNLWNPAAERIFGWTPEEVLGRPPVWVPEDRRAEFRALSSREALGEGYTGFETVRAHRDGRLLDVEISAAPIRDASGAVSGAMAVLSDISDRKRQEEEVRASRARIVQATDEERRKLERNLHDGAQQRLVALSVSLRLAEAQFASDRDAATATLGGAREELARALEELRELARGIHPAVLTDHGLAAAVEALVARVPLPVEVELPIERLPAAVEAALYYVVAESLTNIAKYAEATSARVRVEVDHARGVILEVHDDGLGGADPARGSGLRGLTDRVAALDGSLTVSSPRGGGTCVRVEVPLEHAD